MIKFVLALAFTVLGMVCWRKTFALPQDVESFSLALVSWVIALFLVMSCLLELNTRKPWH